MSNRDSRRSLAPSSASLRSGQQGSTGVLREALESGPYGEDASLPRRRREGILGWWLNLTAPPWPDHPIPVPERERLRKAELTSFSILAIFACLLALVSNSLDDPATAEGVGLMAVFLIVAAILNRAGRTRSAAYLTPGSMMLLIAAVILTDASLRLTDLPLFDFFVIPTVLVAFIGNRRAPWFFAAAAITFIIGTFLLKNYEIITINGTSFNGIAYETNIFGIYGMIDRHVILLFFAALFGWMGARSVDHAIARADRAEEIARLEHAIAEQTHQLEQGIETIRQTHARVANGDFAARAPLEQEHILWQIAYLLNNLIQRLQRSVDAEHLLVRTTDEIERLLQEIHRAKQGLQPLWPQPSGTPLDPLIREFADISGPPRRVR